MRKQKLKRKAREYAETAFISVLAALFVGVSILLIAHHDPDLSKTITTENIEEIVNEY